VGIEEDRNLGEFLLASGATLRRPSRPTQKNHMRASIAAASTHVCSTMECCAAFHWLDFHQICARMWCWIPFGTCNGHVCFSNVCEPALVLVTGTGFGWHQRCRTRTHHHQLHWRLFPCQSLLVSPDGTHASSLSDFFESSRHAVGSNRTFCRDHSGRDDALGDN
jgi:hypothetical protein